MKRRGYRGKERQNFAGFKGGNGTALPHLRTFP